MRLTSPTLGPHEDARREEPDVDRRLIDLVRAIARDDLLGDELALRGGAALHLLHLTGPGPRRPIDRLAYARTTLTAIGPVFDALRAAAASVGLEEGRHEVLHDLAHVRLDARDRSFRLTINTREVDACQTRLRIPLDGVEVLTFTVAELAATKLRAALERREPRDLYDLWLMVDQAGMHPRMAVRCLAHYLEEVPDADAFATDLEAKLADDAFRAGFAELAGDEVGPEEAARRLMAELAPHL